MNEYKLEHIEYVDLDRWRKTIQEARLQYETEVKKLNERLESLHAELNRIQDEESLIAQATRAYKARLQQPSKSTALQGGSLREILIIYFAHPDGVIIGKEVSRSLVDIGYFLNRKNADSAIYTTLGKSPFKKLGRGRYIIPTDSAEWSRLKGNGNKVLDTHSLVKLSQQYRAGLVDRVKSILDEHPTLGVKQVSGELLRQGWDFQGKNPNLAISGAFMRIAKDKKRVSNQTLPFPLDKTS
jgi:hypothetical protein